MGLRDELLRLLPADVVDGVLGKQQIGPVPYKVDGMGYGLLPDIGPTARGPVPVDLEAVGRMARVQPDARQPIDQGLPFDSIVLNLATDLTTTTPYIYKGSGTGLYFRKNGSNLSASIDLIMGGQIVRMFPGTRIRAPFNGFQLFLTKQVAWTFGTTTTAFGPASFIVEKGDHKFEEESDVRTERLFTRSYPSGAAASATYYPVGIGADNGFIDVSGYSTIVYDFNLAQIGGTAPSVSLVVAEISIASSGTPITSFSPATTATQPNHKQRVVVGRGMGTTTTINGDGKTFVGNWQQAIHNPQLVFNVTGAGSWGGQFDIWGVK